MARDYSDTVDLLQQRVRESGNIAVTQNLATQVLGMCERLANTHLKLVTATSNFSSTASTLIYDYRATLTSAVDVLDITESNRPLLRCETLHELTALDADWFRKTDGARFEAFCQLGRDFLVIYPAKAAGGTNDLSITYTKLVAGYATYAGATGNMELPDEHVEIALGLAEVVLLSRMRNLADIKERLDRLARTAGTNFEVN
jgi:hypothetical protein